MKRRKLGCDGGHYTLHVQICCPFYSVSCWWGNTRQNRPPQTSNWWLSKSPSLWRWCDKYVGGLQKLKIHLLTVSNGRHSRILFFFGMYREIPALVTDLNWGPRNFLWISNWNSKRLIRIFTSRMRGRRNMIFTSYLHVSSDTVDGNSADKRKIWAIFDEFWIYISCMREVEWGWREYHVIPFGEAKRKLRR